MVNRGLVGCIAPHISEVGVGVIIKVRFLKHKQNNHVNAKGFTNNIISKASNKTKNYSFLLILRLSSGPQG